jgi:hypothetical protein
MAKDKKEPGEFMLVAFSAENGDLPASSAGQAFRNML